jgi:hypothetical protein
MHCSLEFLWETRWSLSHPYQYESFHADEAAAWLIAVIPDLASAVHQSQLHKRLMSMWDITSAATLLSLSRSLQPTLRNPC